MTALPALDPAALDPAGFACPKDMEHGPCGGVGADGSCEVSPHRCTFLDHPAPRYLALPDPTTADGPGAPPPTEDGAALQALLAVRPLVLTGLPARPLDSASLRACAGELAGAADAVLIGDSGRARVQFPASYRTALARAAGLRVWAGVTCRDRNRVALEGELAALADAGAAGVHCVTGDHTASGGRPEATPVFDLEAFDLLPRARALGLLTSVAESPTAPPVDRRADRVAQKAAAGAQLCFLQYCGGVEAVAAFAEDVRAAGADVPLLPGVPMVVDRAGAEELAGFAAAVLPPGYVEAVLRAADPLAAGVKQAITHGRELLSVPGVGGVVISGAPTAGGELVMARALAVVARALGAGTAPAAPAAADAVARTTAC